MVAVVQRKVHAPFAACKQQALANRVFPDRVDRFVVGQSVDNFLPGFPAVVRAKDPGALVGQANSVDRGVRRLVVESPAVNQRDFAPGRELGRRHVLPGLALHRW